MTMIDDPRLLRADLDSHTTFLGSSSLDGLPGKVVEFVPSVPPVHRAA
jgi:hypothetical protein